MKIPKIITLVICMCVIAPGLSVVFHIFVLTPYIRHTFDSVFLHYKEAIYYMIANNEIDDISRRELFQFCNSNRFPIITGTENEKFVSKPEDILVEHTNMSITVLIICIGFMELMIYILFRWAYINNI